MEKPQSTDSKAKKPNLAPPASNSTRSSTSTPRNISPNRIFKKKTYAEALQTNLVRPTEIPIQDLGRKRSESVSGDQIRVVGCWIKF